MSEEFDHAFEVVIGHEGGYVNNPADPGGETKFGISKRAYPKLDIAALTLADAKAIYERDYWNRIKGDMLPPKAAVQIFDAAVNHGVTGATKIAQSALGVDVDGIIGAQTLRALWVIDTTKFCVLFNAARLEFYTTLVSWPDFSRGWSRRVAKDLREIYK